MNTGAAAPVPPGGSRLSAERILAVAVAIADAEGLASVTMRRLARELSVTAMALYRHFADKDQLLDVMAEVLVAEARFEDDPDSPWDQRFHAVLTGLVALLQKHPWMGRLIIERLVPLPHYLEALEIMLDSARQAGLTAEEGVLVSQQAVQAMAVLVEYEPVPKQQTPEWVAERDSLLDLDPTRFPNVRAAAIPLNGRLSVDTYYRLGIDMIVGGIGQIAAAKPEVLPRSGRSS